MVKKKIISSLTVAGMLGLSATGVVHAATTTDTTKTEALGVYSNIVEGKKVVPFILQSESDRATISDLKAKYPGAVIEGTDDTVLKTGDTFTLNGVEHSVLVYGDVYADGEIDIFDTMEIIKEVKGQGTLSDLQKAAANVNRSDDTIDIFDAMNVVSALKGAVSYDKLTTVPTGADEEKKDEDKKPDDTTATGKLEKKEISSDNNKKAVIYLEFSANAEGYDYIIHNDTDNETVKWSKQQIAGDRVVLTTNNALKEKNDNGKVITYSITVLDANGQQVAKDTFQFRENKVEAPVALSYSDSKYKEISATNLENLSLKVEVNKDMGYETTVEVKLVNYDNGTAIREAVGTATLPAGQKVVNVNNFEGVADLEDGDLGVEITVKDQYGNINRVAYQPTANDTYTTSIIDDTPSLQKNIKAIRKNAEEFKATYVKASRTGTENASVALLFNQKLAVNANEKIKVYYVVAKASETGTPTDAQIKDGKVVEITVGSDANNNTTNVDTVNIPSIEIKNGVSSEEYVVYVITERANGAQTKATSATITSVGAKKLSPVNNIQATSGFGNFRWTDTENEKENPNDVKEYDVIVYATNTTTNDKKAIATLNTTNKFIDVSKEIKDFVKDEKNKDYVDYTIEIVAVAKNGLRDSDPASDANVKISLVKLLAPTAVKVYADEEKNYDLMFDFNAAADTAQVASATNTSLYEVSIYKIDKDGNRAKNATKTVNVPTTAAKDDVDLTSLLFNGAEKGKYAVTVKALAFEGEKYIDSEESTDLSVYYVGAPTSLDLSATDEKTLKISITEIPEIYSVDQANNVKYYAYYREKTKSNSKPWNTVGKLLNKKNGTTVSVELTYTADGITPDTEYEAYVVAEYNNGNNVLEISRTEIKSDTTANTPLDLSAGYTKVVYDNKTIGANKITNNGDTLYVGIATNNVRKVTADNGVDNYKEILDIVKALSKDDKIKTDANNNVVVTKNVTGGTFGNTLENAKLEINKDSIALSADKVKSVAINATGIDGRPIEKVYLGNVGVGEDGIDLTNATSVNEIEVKVGTKVKLAAGTTVKVNGVYVTTSAATEVTATAANELSIKGSNANITVKSEADANKTVKFTDSQIGIVTVVAAKSDRTITLEGAINTVIVGNNSESKGTVDVTNVGYSTLSLAEEGAKVTITKVNKEIALNGVVYTFKPAGTMTIEKVNDNNLDKLQVSGAGVVEFDAGTTANTKADEAIISTDFVANNGVRVHTVASSVKYRVTDGKAYVTLEGNGKATLFK